MSLRTPAPWACCSRFFSATILSTSCRRRLSASSNIRVVSSESARTSGRTRSAKSMRTRASTLSVFSKRPSALACVARLPRMDGHRRQLRLEQRHQEPTRVAPCRLHDDERRRALAEDLHQLGNALVVVPYPRWRAASRPANVQMLLRHVDTYVDLAFFHDDPPAPEGRPSFAQPCVIRARGPGNCSGSRRGTEPGDPAHPRAWRPEGNRSTEPGPSVGRNLASAGRYKGKMAP